jgi:hypothetical protein
VISNLLFLQILRGLRNDTYCFFGKSFALGFETLVFVSLQCTNQYIHRSRRRVAASAAAWGAAAVGSIAITTSQ